MASPVQQFFANGRKKYAKFRVSDSKLIGSPVNWPNSTDDEPVAGDDGTFKYLPVKEDAADAVYDSERFFVEHASVPSGDISTEGTFFHIKHELTERSPEELKLRVENRAKLNDTTLVPMSDIGRPVVLAIAALARKLDGLSVTPTEQEALDTVVGNGAALKVNQDRVKELHDDIDAGRDFDISAGWVNAETPV